MLTKQDLLGEVVPQKVENAIDDIFVEVHQMVGTTSGDITPEQMLELDNIIKQLSNLIINQVNQNL